MTSSQIAVYYNQKSKKVKDEYFTEGSEDMARLSDVIEEFIKSMIEGTEMGSVEIQRNELAGQFNCVPSQINYVISTRFSPDKGYFVESRRGGGGCIKICRIHFDNQSDKYLMHVLAEMGESISQRNAEIFVNNFCQQGVLTDREGKIMMAALSDTGLKEVPAELRDRARALQFKNIITALML